MKIQTSIQTLTEAPMLSCKEVASYLGISLSAFWHKCRQGEIPHIRVSARCYRIKRADLETYLNSRAR